MQKSDQGAANGGVVPVASGGSVPINELVIEVYESSEPTAKRRMLNLLVGRAYAIAPPVVRKSLLEHLMRPLGALGLISVAGGIFAKFRFRDGWSHLSIRLEDLQEVRNSDVIALVDYVQQVSAGALTDAVRMLASAPAMTGTGVAAVLVSLLLSRSIDRGRVARG